MTTVKHASETFATSTASSTTSIGVTDHTNASDPHADRAFATAADTALAATVATNLSTGLATKAAATISASGTAAISGNTIGGAADYDVVVSLTRTMPDANYNAVAVIQVGGSGFADLLLLGCRVKSKSTTAVTVTVHNSAVGGLVAAINVTVMAGY